MQEQVVDLAHLRKWVGSTERVSERVVPFPSMGLAALLDLDGVTFGDGEALPALGHWLHFHNPVSQSELGPDGHPKRGGFLPPVPLPRRMWAGSSVDFHEPVIIGEEAERVSTVEKVEAKEGRSGTLIFVQVMHRISARRKLCIEERQKIVYREAPKEGEAAPLVPAPDDAEFSCEIVPDPVLLMRYTALTFNGHRIHYDRDYATGEEGYPGLVVHGPLMATMLVNLAIGRFPETRLKHFGFRGIAPVFDTHGFSIHGRADQGDNLVRLWVRRHDGAQAIEATAEFG